MRWPWYPAMVLALAGCSEERREASFDVERMNEAALGPPVPIDLQPISFNEANRADMLGAGCIFMRDEGREMLVIAQQRYALFKHDGQFVRAASDTGSQQLPLGAFAHYDGLENAIRFSFDPQSERIAAPEVVYYDAAVGISDEHDRAIYKATGVLQCGS